jgi:tetratricopeptide (TPR) repeat protein
LPPSVAPVSRVRTVSLALGEEVERAAREALAMNRHADAIALLSRGLELGAAAFREGDAALGRSAITVFGKLLGRAYRDAGRLADSLQALREALPHAAADPRGRSRLLAELSETLVASGQAREAEAARVEALRLAGDASDRVLTAELRRRAPSAAPRSRRVPEGAARAGATPSPVPPPRRSEWRFRPGAEPAVREKPDAGVASPRRR